MTSTSTRAMKASGLAAYASSACSDLVLHPIIESPAMPGLSTLMVAALADRQGFRNFLGASADDRDFAVPRLSRTSESQGGPCGIVTAFNDRLQLQRNSPSPVTRLSKDQSGSHGVGLQ